MNAETKPMGLWSKHLVRLLIANTLVVSCMFFHNAVTTLYVVSIGGTAAYAGLMLSCFTAVALIMRIVSGQLLDKRGRRKIILFGLVVYAAATASLTIPFLPWLPFARALQAIGYSTITTGLSVAVADVSPLPKMGEGLGYYILTNNLATALGPVIALWIYSISRNYAVVYYASIALLAIAFLIMLLCRYESDQDYFDRKRSYELALLGAQATRVQQHENDNLSFISTVLEKKALPSTICSIFIYLGHGAIVAYIVLFADSISIENASLFFMLQAAATIAARLAFASLSDRHHPLFSIIPGALILALGYFLLMKAPDRHILFYIAGAALGMGSGIANPALNAEAVRHVPQNRRGAASATFFMSNDIGIGTGGLIWGNILDRSGFRPMFLGCCICIFISIIFSLLFFTKKRVISA